MEKPVYPLKNMRITQGYNKGTHVESYAIDDAGKDTGIESIYAPFTGIIKKIYTQDANEVWIESENPVEYPDGTIDYMTIMFAHANDISNLYVGKKIKRKEVFYQEGTKGNATGNHCHIECARGKFIAPGWKENSQGYYVIINSKKPEECLWIDDGISIIQNQGYNFQKIKQEETGKSETEQPPLLPETDETLETEDGLTLPETNEEVESEEPSIKLIYTCKQDGLYGIYLKENEQVFIK